MPRTSPAGLTVAAAPSRSVRCSVGAVWFGVALTMAALLTAVGAHRDDSGWRNGRV